MENFSKNLCRTIVALLCWACAGWAQADGYPSRPVTLIIPTGPGGGTDLVARVMTNRLAQVLGQPVVIQNRAGAGGIVGNQDAARAAPDGYTLLMSSNQFAMIPAVQGNLPYDPVKDFIPITSIGMIPTLVVVNPQLPVHSLPELIAYAKARPSKLQYASAGIGSPNHLFGELLDRMAGMDVLHVAYRGAAAALLAVASGEASLAYASLPASQSFLDAGKIKALAITSGKRSQRLPDLPAVAETVPGYDAEIWLGIWGVAGTPPDVIAKVHAALLETMKDPAVAKGLADLGLELQPRSQEEFERVVNDELKKWARLVDESGGAIQKQKR